MPPRQACQPEPLVVPSLTLAAAVARRSFGGHGGSSSAAVFDANVRKWFSCFGKIEEGAKGVQLRVKEPQGERGLYRSYCLVTFEFVGGKMEALQKGVEVSRDKNAMSEDLVALNLKPLDKGKKGNSPLSEAKCKARMEILQRAVDNYNRYTPRWPVSSRHRCPVLTIVWVGACPGSSRTRRTPLQ